MNIAIADRLLRLRKAHGFSQEELAEKIGISRQSVSKWERAEASPDTDNLIALARLYGVSLDELLLSDEEESKGRERGSSPFRMGWKTEGTAAAVRPSGTECRAPLRIGRPAVDGDAAEKVEQQCVAGFSLSGPRDHRFPAAGIPGRLVAPGLDSLPDRAAVLFPRRRSSP